MPTSEPSIQADPSQIAAGGCILSLPLILAGMVSFLFKMSNAKSMAMAHQVEEVDIEQKDGVDLIPTEESLTRFVTTLKRITTPFDKMGARFEPENYEAEKRKLESIQKRIQEETSEPSPQTQQLLQEAAQLLARYAP